MDGNTVKQLVLTADKQTDGSTVHTLIEVQQTEDNKVRFPWNAQSINQAVLDLLVEAIAARLGVEPIPIDLVEIGQEIAASQGIEFRGLNDSNDQIQS